MTAVRETVAGTSLLRRPGRGGPVLVLLHGIGSDAESWAAVLVALDPAFEALAWDAPGYGGSAPVAPAAPTPEDYAARLCAVLDALGPERVVLVGHSLGALFAGRFAAGRPHRVAALALLSPALGYGVAPGAPLPPPVQARIDDLQAVGPAAFAELRAPRLVHQPADKPEVLAGVRRAMSGVRPAGYAQAVRALGGGDLLADAARIAAPTLVAVGTEDAVTPPANARAVHGALRRPVRDVELVPHVGHALPQEAPARVAALLGALALETKHV
jgi:pimeloyl-ACP methyl ester carboxylesterase